MSGEPALDAPRRRDGLVARVLVVDDDVDSRTFLSDCLMRKGYRVESASSAPAAIRFLDKDLDVDLIVSDVNMPHIDGLELRYELSQRGLGDIPFVVVTAEDTLEKHEAAAKLGAIAVIAKPLQDLRGFLALIAGTIRATLAARGQLA